MKKLLIILFTVLSVGLINNSCDIPEAEIGISQDFMKHVAQVNFITDTSNEASGTLMEELDNTKVTITGPDAAKVYNIEGKKDFVITGGMVHLLLDPSADFVSNEEYTVNLTIEPVGYLKRIIPITFNKDENTSSYEVAMLKKTSLPKGISLSTNNIGSVDNTTGLNKSINLIASNASIEGVSTEITIPAGIKMKDSNNNLLSGKLEVEIISFSETDDATAYYPGGLAPTNIDMGDGKTESGTFVSAGFAAIHMAVGGKKVKTFEGEKVAVKMTLSKKNYNPITEKPFKLDDTIDIWSYDEDKGQWKFESKGIVKKDTNDSLYVAFETSHLSYFNLDCLFGGDDGKCYSSIKFNWSDANVADINCRLVFKYIGTTTATNNWYSLFTTKEAVITKGETFELYNAPKSRVSLEIYDIRNGKLLITKIFEKGELCNNPVVDLIPLNSKNPTVTLKYQGMCTVTNTKVLPPVGTRIYFKKSGTNAWRPFYYVTYRKRLRSKISTNLLTLGQSYDFKIFAGGKSTIRTYTINKVDYFIDVKLTDDICAGLTK